MNGCSGGTILLRGRPPGSPRFFGFTGYVSYAPFLTWDSDSKILTPLSSFSWCGENKDHVRTLSTPIPQSTLLTPNSSSSVIDRLIQQQKMSVGSSCALAYFYCKRDASGSSNPDLVMSAIVKQLACSAVGLALQEPVVSMYTARKAAGFSSNSLSFHESLDLIISLASAYSQTSIVVDALDECDPLKRRKFLDSLQTIIKSSSGIVKIFVSSRDDNDIVRQLDGVPNLWIEAKDNKDDIERFVELEITRCIDSGELLDGVVDNGLKGRIIETLTKGSEGMYNSPHFSTLLNHVLKSISHRFLWVDLQIKELCAMDVAPDVESRLGALPETLASTYTEIYHRIMSQRGTSPQLAKCALMWVMCSGRPFSPLDLASAVSFRFTGSGLDARSVFKICHNLLTLDLQSNIVQFAHLSVREFLEQTQFTTTEAHMMALEGCIYNMLQPDTFTTFQSLGSTYRKVFPVIGYPVIYWPRHAVECQDQVASGNLKLRTLLVDFLKRCYTDWLRTARSVKKRFG